METYQNHVIDEDHANQGFVNQGLGTPYTL